MTDLTGQALLAAISADDPTARLALADWLEEHDDARAAWVRDAGLWAYMAPDLRDPVPGLLAAIEACGGPTSEQDRLLRLVGPPMVRPLRAWVRADLTGRFWSCRRLLWDMPPPPAADPMLEAAEPEPALYEDDWFICYTAALDLRRCGPLVSGFVVGRLIEVCGETWDLGIGVGGDVRDAAIAALGAIGPAAESAVPLLLSYLRSDDLASAVRADLARDALVAIRPPPEAIRGRLHYARHLEEVRRLREVLRAPA